MPYYNFRKPTLIPHTGVTYPVGAENVLVTWPGGYEGPVKFDDQSAFYPTPGKSPAPVAPAAADVLETADAFGA